MKYLKILFFLNILCFYSFINAFDINSILPVKENIIDKTNTLTETEKNSINLQIEDIRKKYTAEILLLIIPSTQGEDIAKLSTDIWQKVWVWKADKDNWVVILIALNDRNWNISTWYWVEWALPDLIVNKIWQKNFSLFKEQKYFEWISWAINDIDKYLAWDKSIISTQNNKNDEKTLIIFIIEFVFVTIFSSAYLKRLVKENYYKKTLYYLLLSYLISIPLIYILVWIEWIFINIFIWIFWWISGIFWKAWKWWWGGFWGWGSSGGWFGWFGGWSFWWWWSSWKW